MCNCDSFCWQFDDCCEDICTFCSADYPAENQCAAGGDDTIAQGETCWQQDEECVDGTGCTLNSDFTDLLCYPEQSTGSSCGWGVGPCGDDAACMFTDETFSGFQCYADQSEGTECGIGLGQCEEGFSCYYTDKTVSKSQCYKDLPVGSSCAWGKGLCETGSQCYLVSETTGAAVCMKDNALGQPCGLALGGCEENTHCVLAEGENTATCLGENTEGQVCGLDVAVCESGLGCKFTAEGDPTGICKPLMLAGGTCGPGGDGVCAGPLTCAWTDATETVAKCYKDGLPGDACGSDIGTCWNGLTCVATAPGSQTGTCTDLCAQDNKYGDGTCDECILVDTDCVPGN
jgi:hypothetical protein